MTPALLAGIWAQPDQRPQFSLAQWEMVLGQARQSRLLGRLAHHHAFHHWMSAVPAQPRQYLEGALRLLDRQHQQVQREVDAITQAFLPLGVPVVMLKGAAYFVADLPPRHGRFFSDIDILVDHQHLAEVERALFRAGWISEERNAYNDRYYRQWMHEIPPMKHVQRGTVIDVHHTITPPTSRFKVDAAWLLAHIVPVTGHPGLFVLAPVDMVLHSAVHLFQEGEFDHGLRDLLDIQDLLVHFSQALDFWGELLDRAQALGLNEPLFHVLYQLRRLFGAGAPPAIYLQLERTLSHRLGHRFLCGLLNVALQPAHPSCDTPGSGLVRWLLYVRSHYLRMPWYLVISHLMRKAAMQYFPPKPAAPAFTLNGVPK